jgi:cell division septation protein DedD
MGLLFCITSFAGFLPDEVPVPASPSTNQNIANDEDNIMAPSPDVWQIVIASTPKTVADQVKILRKGGLPAYAKVQGNQASIIVGPELDKTKLQQEQKIVLELLDTAGTIVPYQITR